MQTSNGTSVWLRLHNSLVLAFALSPFNKWMTGEEVHHDPTPLECVDHFTRSGGLAEVERLEQELELASTPVTLLHRLNMGFKNVLRKVHA